MSHVKLANNNRSITGAIFLDIEGAFNNVVTSVLLGILRKLGFTDKVVSFVVSSRKLIGYAADSPFQNREVKCGLPQSSVLSSSSLLFSLYTSFVESCLLLSVCILVYTDEIVIYCSHFSR